MSNAFLPRGTQFQRSTDGVTYVTMGEAKKAAFSIKGDFLDVTNFDTSTAYKEFLPGMIDGGTVKVEANFLNNDTTQNALLGDLGSQTLLYWKLVLPNTRGHFAWQGYVEEFAPDYDVEKAAAQSIAIKITGQCTWTPNA